jgi:phosphatidylserine/phosphatidylglycerophosphate/cardiolipin synthase-like enzyme
MSSDRRRRTQQTRSTRQAASGGQRLTIGGITAAVIIVIVFIAQYVLGIDVLPEEEVPPPPVASEAPSGNVVPIDGGIDGGWFQVYFTAPINTQDESRFVGSPVENALIRAIDNARETIDAAMFELNSQLVTDALIAAHERGVTVRIVTDGEHGLESPETTVDQLEAAGISVVSDGRRSGFMHNKFFVIDDLYVWTGSTNITHNGFYNNNNNSIMIRSTRLASNFSHEFDELFRGEFGTTSPGDVPYPSINVGGTQIVTIFESEGDLPAEIVRLINSARVVRFMAFSLTLDDLLQPMQTRVQAGRLEVQGIIEASQRRFLAPLFCADLDIRQDGNPDILHHKVFIINEDIVIMGSFNFSGSAATSNDENALIIYNQDIARAYLDEFERRWAEAVILPKTIFDC